MVVDTSAVIAILMGEVEAGRIASALASDALRLMSAFSALEAAIVVESRKGPAGAHEWELLQTESEIDIVPFTAGQQILAAEAWRNFGKGRHQASLNIGDCCAYALAKHTGEPLLYKGTDFAHTDVVPVPW